MADRRTALFGALAWWFARRWIRRRAERAVAGLAMGAAARRGRIRGALAGSAGVLGPAAAFLVWRRLFARADEGWEIQPEAPTAPADAPAAP